MLPWALPLLLMLSPVFSGPERSDPKHRLSTPKGEVRRYYQKLPCPCFQIHPEGDHWLPGTLLFCPVAPEEVSGRTVGCNAEALLSCPIWLWPKLAPDSEVFWFRLDSEEPIQFQSAPESGPRRGRGLAPFSDSITPTS